jgi:hypothetical protein
MLVYCLNESYVYVTQQDESHRDNGHLDVHSSVYDYYYYYYANNPHEFR